MTDNQSFNGNWYSIVANHTAWAHFQQEGNTLSGSIGYATPAPGPVAYELDGKVDGTEFTANGQRDQGGLPFPKAFIFKGTLGMDGNIRTVTIENFPVIGGFRMIPDSAFKI